MTLYSYAHDPLGLAELVYQLVKDGKVVYYGITERTALEQANEHIVAGKDFSHMKVLAENLTHDQARSLEGGLIRKRIAEELTTITLMSRLKQSSKSQACSIKTGDVR